MRAVWALPEARKWVCTWAVEDRRQGETGESQADEAKDASGQPPAAEAAADQAAADDAGADDANQIPSSSAEVMATAEPAADASPEATTDERDAEPARGGRGGGGETRADRSIPLRKLVELAAKYGEIGPPLAELCFAIGESETGDQLVRLGTQGGAGGGVEYWFVAANAARRQRRYADALRATVEAVQSFAATPDQSLGAEGESRFLHLIRLGFATLMFDIKDLTAEPGFATALAEGLPKLEGRLGTNAFFRTLQAQTLWFSDKDASEREWDRADELGDPETTWNARGTWYNEAERDPDKAERAYRKGLEKVPTSALLMHNLAQILLEKARRPGLAVEEVRRRLNQSTELLRSALRQDAPRLRRHIHATRDRVEELRRTLPPPPARSGGDNRDRRPGGGPGDRDRRPGGGRPGGNYARDRGPGGYGGDRGGHGSHQQQQQQAAGDRGGAPADRGPSADRGPAPDRGPRRPPRDSQQPPRQQQPRQKFLVDGTVSLGEMILAKLKEQQEKG